MTYRSPLDAARARISALEDLLRSRRFEGGTEPGADLRALRDARAAIAEERSDHAATSASHERQTASMRARIAELERELVDEHARRRAEVSLLRTKLEEAERAVATNASLFEAEQTIQRAEMAAQGARLAQQITQKNTLIRELREEIRVHLDGDRAAIRAHYSATVRTVGTELAELGDRARRLERTLGDARTAVDSLPPVDLRDREAMVERELAKRKVAIGEVELERVRDRATRLEQQLRRITEAEATLAGRA